MSMVSEELIPNGFQGSPADVFANVATMRRYHTMLCKVIEHFEVMVKHEDVEQMPDSMILVSTVRIRSSIRVFAPDNGIRLAITSIADENSGMMTVDFIAVGHVDKELFEKVKKAAADDFNFPDMPFNKRIDELDGYDLDLFGQLIGEGIRGLERRFSDFI